MAAHLAEIDAVANNPAKPTLANTIEAMERAGEPLDRAQAMTRLRPIQPSSRGP